MAEKMDQKTVSHISQQDKKNLFEGTNILFKDSKKLCSPLYCHGAFNCISPFPKAFRYSVEFLTRAEKIGRSFVLDFETQWGGWNAGNSSM